jgi:hypothetical protein
VSLTQAALTSGEKPVYVALDQPCRVIDTRPAPDNVGTAPTPIAAGEAAALTVKIAGANGNCTGALAIPTDAVGVAVNLTAINNTTRSHFRVYPADAALPLTSNLNFGPGQTPIANKVDVGLSSPAGEIKIYNHAGTTDAAVDIFGYYIDHNHDDRYYTETEVDAAMAAARSMAAYSGGDQQIALTTTDQVVRSVSITAPAAGKVIVNSSGYVWLASGADVIARCSLTTGTSLESVSYQFVEIHSSGSASDVVSGTRGYDVTAGQNLTVNLVCDEFSGQANVSDTWISAIFVPN